MKLTQIEISDFRSILKQKIDFDNDCIGLIGLNESGKSNVLNAIRGLDKNFIPTLKDKSKISGKFPTIVYEFKLENEETEIIKKVIQDIILSEIKSKDQIVYLIKNISTLKKIVKVENLNDSIERKYNFDIQLDLIIDLPILSRVKNIDVPSDALVRINEDQIELSTINHIEKLLVPPEYLSFFEEFNSSSVIEILKVWLNESFNEKTPQIIFWEYQPKYLLPSEISYEDLMANETPYENSAPLYNIFLLSKSLQISSSEDLRSKIAIWKSDSSERRKDSSIITQDINKYIKSIWSDYNQDLVIELEENKITIHVNDPISIQKNYYEMEARSQGFKTFISFILTIAAEAENEIVSNFILLLDEPETHLHPSGVRYMKEELLKLSQKGNNIIIYSTHSIFMIDRNNLKRHLIVSKEHELTKLTKVERNNFIQEAVIYEAMGTSIDEFSIGTKNLIFEGELDLKLFDFFFLELYNKELVKNILDYEKWDGGGVKRIEQFLNNKMLPKRSEWIIILDNDSPGQGLAKTIDTKIGANSNFKIRHIHYSKTQNFELEDILPKNIIQKSFLNTIEELKIDNKHPIDFLTEIRPVSMVINEFKGKHKFNVEQASLFEELFKKSLDQNVEQELKIIAEKATQEERLQLFKSKFDLYHDFITQFVDKFFKSISKSLFDNLSLMNN